MTEFLERLRGFLERIRGEREPTRVALTLTEAVHQHLAELLTDDPGDSDRETLLLIREADGHADALCRVLRELVQR